MSESPAAYRWPRARVVLTLFAYRFLGSLVVAYPAARFLAAFGPSARPDGDLSFFAPGAERLLEALRVAGRGGRGAVEGGLVVLSLVGFLGLVPLSVALAALLAPRAPWSAVASRAVERFPTLTVVSGVGLLAQAVVLTAGGFGASFFSRVTEDVRDERVATWVGVAFVLATAVLAAVIGVLQDLTRAAVASGARALDGLDAALRTLRSRPLALASAWLALVVPAALTVALAAWVTGVLDVSRPGSARVAGVLAAHQLAVLLLCALKARWLGRTLSFVRRDGAA